MKLIGLDARFRWLPVCLRLMLFLFLNFFSNKVFCQLKAAFSANITEGCAPLIVHFKDGSTGNPTAYKWNLGNNITPHTDKDPSTTYINPGSYTVKLVIKNAANTADSIEKTSYIRVWATPLVNFKASDSAGCYPNTIRFTDLSTPGDGTITNWLWDFGDGNTSTDPNPSHEYTARGNYNVTLRITNSHGCDRTFSKIEYIRLQNGVLADFSFSTPNTCKAPAPVTFNNSSTGTGTLNYSWQFGDQGTSTEKNPVHTYTQAGSFSIKLVVANDAGCRDTIIKTNAINIGTVKAEFSAADVVCEGEAFQLNNISEPSAVSSFWEFGDGTTSNVMHVSKTYNKPGTFTIRLTSNFGSCTDVVSRTITVLPKPLAAFTATGNISCRLPFTVSFQNKAQGATSYLWDFGDGNTSTSPDPSHVYTRSGRFNVTLTVKGANGCGASSVSYGLVRAEPLQVRLLNLPLKGCVPLQFTPEVQINTVDSISSYEWQFGNGDTSSDPVPRYTYTSPGIYTVQLIVRTAGGCLDTVVYKDAISVGLKPDVKFSATPRETCAFTSVQFRDESTTPGTDEWFWEFGDGGSSGLQHPSHNYSDTGYFPVLLTVYHSGCKSELLLNNYIHILPPVAKFDIEMNSCSDRYKRQFINHSAGATSWIWDFGDGTTSTEKDPEHVFTKPGIYKVMLTVKNAACEHSINRQVQIIDQQPAFTASDTLACKNEQLTFTVSGVSAVNLNYVTWDYGDGSSQRIYSSVSKHRYLKSGVYDVLAIVADINGCADTLSRKQYISVKGPVAGFSTGNNAVCKDGTIVFHDDSKTDQGSPLKQWIWQYGDGISDTLTAPPFQHIYRANGSFSVGLKVVDSMGCTDQVTRSGLVLISRPVAAFMSPDTLSCNDKNIRFINQSVGSALNYLWDFGDGNGKSQLTQPNHSYNQEGNYAVKLVVKDSYGCLDSLTRTNYIHIKNPLAAFTVNDSLATCPPLVTTFRNSSQNFTAYHWDFGDRTSSAIDNPTHIYNYPGVYRARLIVTSRGGCQDTSEQQMVVRGPQGSFTYPDTVVCVPATISFKGSSNDQVSFIWDYNNGNTEPTTDSSVSYTYDAPGIYYPKMILVDRQGCKVSVAGTKPLVLKGVLAKLGLSKQVLCDSGLVMLKDQSVTYELISSYNWSFGDGTFSGLKDPQHYYTTPGKYPIQLNVTTASGCRDSVDVLTVINVALSPKVSITGPAELCAPAFFQLAGNIIRTDTTSLAWNWDLGKGRTATVINPHVNELAEDTIPVRVIATSGWGCSDTAMKSLVVHPLPLLNAGADTVVCLGNAFKAMASGADFYNWAPASLLSCSDCPSPIIKPEDNIRLLLTGETRFGCKAEDSLIIQVKKPFKLTVSAADTICIGSAVRLTSRGADRYNWSPSTGVSNPDIQNPVVNPSVTTIYRVTGWDDHHCFYDTAYVPVAVYPYPTVTAGDDKSILVGNMVKLDGKVSADVNSVSWTPSIGLDCSNCEQPVASPKKTTNYRVQVSNEGGCKAEDKVTVFVLCNQGNLFIPNTFSPNGDGNNDVFYPRGKGVYGIKSLKIFDRWGEMVFERNNFQVNEAGSGWNGKYKGKEAGQDVYVYTMEIVCENNTVLSFKGNVALLR